MADGNGISLRGSDPPALFEAVRAGMMIASERDVAPVLGSDPIGEPISLSSLAGRNGAVGSDPNQRYTCINNAFFQNTLISPKHTPPPLAQWHEQRVVIFGAVVPVQGRQFIISHDGRIF